MGTVRGFSELFDILEEDSGIKNGCLIDTSALFSAAYDLDALHDKTAEFTDLLAENEIPLFCNVNIRSEFLEQFRRIIFTEALLDFEASVDKKKLPEDFAQNLINLRKRNETAKSKNKALRLSEKELKDDFKLVMSGIKGSAGSLWEVLCRDKVAGKLAQEWKKLVDDFGINFIGTRGVEASSYLRSPLNWEDAVNLIEKTGMSSSDAMISNLFMCSTLSFLITNDADILLAARHFRNEQVVVVPNSMLKIYQHLL